MHQKAREGPSEPYEGDFVFGEAESEEVGCAVGHFEVPNGSVITLALTKYVLFAHLPYCIPTRLIVSNIIRVASDEPLICAFPAHDIVGGIMKGD